MQTLLPIFIFSSWLLWPLSSLNLVCLTHEANQNACSDHSSAGICFLRRVAGTGRNPLALSFPSLPQHIYFLTTAACLQYSKCKSVAISDACRMHRGTQGINEQFCSQPSPRNPWIINGTWGCSGNWIANLVITGDLSVVELYLCLIPNVCTGWWENYWSWGLFTYFASFKKEREEFLDICYSDECGSFLSLCLIPSKLRVSKSNVLITCSRKVWWHQKGFV